MLYDAKNAYQLNDLSPQSWYKLVNKFGYDNNLFNEYVYRYNSEYYNNTCTGQCQKNYLCEILFINQKQYDNCIKS